MKNESDKSILSLYEYVDNVQKRYEYELTYSDTSTQHRLLAVYSSDCLPNRKLGPEIKLSMTQEELDKISNHPAIIHYFNN